MEERTPSGPDSTDRMKRTRLPTLACCAPSRQVLGAVLLVLAGCSRDGPTDPASSLLVITPAEASLAPGESQQFRASAGGSAVSGVRWSLEGVGGVGTMSADGRYTAPASVPTGGLVVRIVAARSDRQAGRAEATVAVTPAPAGEELALSVIVSDSLRARAFYVEALGFRDGGAATGFPSSVLRMFLYRWGDATLKVRVYPSAPRAQDGNPTASNGIRFITVPVSGFDSTLARITSQGFVAPTVRTDGGVRTALAFDGDGNAVELVDAATSAGRRLEIGILDTDSASARRFYMEILELPRLPSVRGPAPVANGSEQRFRAGRTVLRVFTPPGARPNGPNAVDAQRGFRYITFTTPSGMEAIHTRLTGAGVTFVTPWNNFGTSASLFMVSGPGGAIHEFVGPPRVPKTGFAGVTFTAELYAPAMAAGEAVGQITEMGSLEIHNGRLYASGSYIGPSETPASSDPKILVKDAADAPWRVEYRAGNRHTRVMVLRSVRFTTDGTGRPLPQPVSILVAGTGAWRAWNPDGVYVLSRDEPSGQWIEHKLSSDPWNPLRLNHTNEVRALFDHVDRVTGVHYVFASSSVGRIWRGWYDPGRPGKIAWEPQAELDGLLGYGLSFAEANGSLYVGIAFGANGDELRPDVRPIQDHGLWRRVDGVRDPAGPGAPPTSRPQWEWVRVPQWESALVAGQSTRTGQLRGLTALPTPGGQEVLALHWDSPDSRVEIVDPGAGHSAMLDLDSRAFVRGLWGNAAGMITLGYNDWTPAVEPGTGARVHLIGAWANYPGGEAGGELGKSSWFVVRRGAGSYDLVRIWDPTNPLTGRQYGLRGCRSIRPSPFPSEAGRVWYFAGFDGSNTGQGQFVRDASGSWGWIYRGVVTP